MNITFAYIELKTLCLHHRNEIYIYIYIYIGFSAVVLN